MRKQMAFAFFFFLLLILPVAFTQQQQPAAADETMTDASALLLLKGSFTGADPALSSWSSSSTTPCGPQAQWLGVVCFQGMITGLRLARLGLSGTVNFDALAHFKGLRSISLNGNNLSGPLSPALAGLRSLKSLFLSHNNFSGEIPDEVFASMRHLKKLWLDHNQFSGRIPSSIANATSLMELRLDSNAFDGGIPSLGHPSLKWFNVSNNHLTGPVPDSLARFNASSFAGNADLCGPPLDSTSCPAPASTQSGGTNYAFVIGLVVAGAVLIALILFLCRRREEKFDTLGTAASAEAMETAAAGAAVAPPVATTQKQEQDSGSSHKRNGSGRGTGTATTRGAAELVMINEEKGVFGLADLMKATAEVLGNGGLGSAYKAAMANGLTVAVKRMRDMNRLGKEAFDGHMRRLGSLHHPNILTPLAYHYRKDEKLIVSEYVRKGSLRYVLHGDRGADHRALDWPTRLRIARGMVRGMVYLHTELTALDIPHGNLKSANVLLGDDYEPMIADHGLAALVGAAQASQVMFAYRTPEGTQHRVVSPKSDVYCLGVVILELVTGKFPSQYMNNTKGGTDVVQWAASAIADKREGDLLDRDIATQSLTADMVRLLRIGAACVDPNPEERPDMEEVASLIEEIANTVAATEPHHVVEEQ